MPIKEVQILNNAPSHPGDLENEEDEKTHLVHITSLSQPIDQKVLKSFKRWYRLKLRNFLQTEDRRYWTYYCHKGCKHYGYLHGQVYICQVCCKTTHMLKRIMWIIRKLKTIQLMYLKVVARTPRLLIWENIPNLMC